LSGEHTPFIVGEDAAEGGVDASVLTLRDGSPSSLLEGGVVCEEEWGRDRPSSMDFFIATRDEERTPWVVPLIGVIILEWGKKAMAVILTAS